MMKQVGVVLVVALSGVMLALACSLNPQPLPPGDQSDSATGGSAGPGASSGGGGPSFGSSSGGSSGGLGESLDGAVSDDAAKPVDGSQGADGGSSDAPTDAPESGSRDGEPGDATTDVYGD
jgi:hypothetical protein